MTVLLNPFILGATTPVDPVDPAAPAARYWRVRALDYGDPNDQPWLISALRFYDLSGAQITANVAANAISGSEFDGSRTKDHAFDGNSDTDWGASGNLPSSTSWIGYDFGSDVSVGAVELDPRQSAEWQSRQKARRLAVEYSDDNSIWTTAWITNHHGFYFEAGIPSTERHEDPNETYLDGSAHHFMLAVASATGTGVKSINKLGLLDSSGGDLLNNDTLFTASSVDGSNIPVNMLSDNSSIWASSEDYVADHEFVIVSHPSKISPVELQIIGREDTGFIETQSPMIFALFASNGGPWELLHAGYKGSWTSTTDEEYTAAITIPTKSLPAATGHKYWRLEVTGSNDSKVRIDHLQFQENLWDHTPNTDVEFTASADSGDDRGCVYEAKYRAADTIYDSGTVSLSGASPVTLEYEFPEKRDIKYVHMIRDQVSNSPTAFNVQSSDDGSSWTTEWSESWDGWSQVRSSLDLPPNLLVDGDGSSTSGWSNVTNVDTDDGTNSTQAPDRGSSMFRGVIDSPAHMDQDVDVSGNATQIDAGDAIYGLFFEYASWASDPQALDDEVEVTLTFKDTGGSHISSVGVERVGDRTTWQSALLPVPVPENTRTINVEIRFTGISQPNVAVQQISLWQES